MLNVTGGRKVYLAVEPADMRKGFGGPYALASEKMREDHPFVSPHESIKRRVIFVITAIESEILYPVQASAWNCDAQIASTVRCHADAEERHAPTRAHAAA
jgi:hypothetical protein